MVACTVTDNEALSRYEITDESGELAGFSRYDRRVIDGAEVTVIHHTLVYPDYQGQGIGSQLVRGSLLDIRHRGGFVVPECPHVEGWIDRHPDFDDLVVAVDID